MAVGQEWQLGVPRATLVSACNLPREDQVVTSPLFAQVLSLKNNLKIHHPPKSPHPGDAVDINDTTRFPNLSE